MAYFTNYYSYNSYSNYGYGSQFSRSFVRQLSCRSKLVCVPKPKCKEINIVSKPGKPFRRGDYIAVGDKLVKVKRLKVECESDKTASFTSDSTDALGKSIKDAKKKVSEVGTWGYRKGSESCKIYEFSVLDKK